jgi:hypothetical protein
LTSEFRNSIADPQHRTPADIAVDGWALTLLSKGNLSYASTAQTIGLNIGYFLSFTVFLAFNSVEFSNKYFRPASAQLDYPLVSLAGYLRWAALAYAGVTTYLALFQPEVILYSSVSHAGLSPCERADASHSPALHPTGRRHRR